MRCLQPRVASRLEPCRDIVVVVLSRTPLKRSSMRRKPARSKGEFHPAVRAAIESRSRGRCEADTPVCTISGSVIHHILRRSQGGMGVVTNGLHLCDPCHRYIHENPSESYANGWMARSSRAH